MDLHVKVTRALVLGVVALAACGDDEGTRPGDTASPDTSVDTSAPDTSADTSVPDTSTPDTSVPDTGADTSVPDTSADTSVPDTSTPDSSEPDTSEPDTTEPDTTEPGETYVAAPGVRCALGDRIGLVTVESAFGQTFASARIDDAPNPWYGEPELSDGSCGFYRFDPGSGCAEPCTGDALCSRDGQCVPAPAPIALALVVRNPAGAESFVSDEVTGEAWGEVTLPGPSFEVEVGFGDVTIVLGPTSLPSELADLVGTLAGEYDHPTSLDLSWTVPPVAFIVPARPDTSVFTHIPINHHAAGPTFTECTVGSWQGALHVDGAMLEPLAVVTGLEFQGIEHARFAAAETPAGCVELRFIQRQYVSLEAVP